jgi:hypothetical protein
MNRENRAKLWRWTLCGTRDSRQLSAVRIGGGRLPSDQ